MARRGPAPEPDEDLAARGSSVPRRRAKKAAAAPVAAADRPSCPDWLPAEAKAEWARVCEQLATMGLLATADRSILAAYCEAWAEAVTATRLIEEGEPVLDKRGREVDRANRGYLIEGSTGSAVLNPLVRVKNAALDRMARLADRLGLNPKARTTVKAQPAKPKQLPARKR